MKERKFREKEKNGKKKHKTKLMKCHCFNEQND